MATLTVTTPAITGTTLTPVAAAGGGDVFPNDGGKELYINNASGSSINLTITPGGTPGGLTLSPIVIAIPTGTIKLIGYFPPGYFNNASGQVALTYSAVTSVTVAVLG